MQFFLGTALVGVRLLSVPTTRVARTSRYCSSISAAASVPVYCGGSLLYSPIRRPSRSQHTLLLHVFRYCHICTVSTPFLHRFYTVSTPFLHRFYNVFTPFVRCFYNVPTTSLQRPVMSQSSKIQTITFTCYVVFSNFCYPNYALITIILLLI